MHRYGKIAVVVSLCRVAFCGIAIGEDLKIDQRRRFSVRRRKPKLLLKVPISWQPIPAATI